MGWSHPAGHDSYQPALPFAAAEYQQPAPNPPEQPEPRTINATEARLLNLLTEKQPLTFEDFITLTLLPIPKLSLTLLNLEIKGIIRSLPGRRYHLAS
jgi:DNA processing protein